MDNYYDDDKILNEFLKTRLDKNSLFNFEVKPIVDKFIGSVKNKSILDIGCGLGEIVNEFSKKGAKKVVGIDISVKEIEYAKNNYKQKNNEFLVLDANNLHLMNDKWDIILGLISFDYIENFNSLISNVSRLLNKNGCLILAQVHPFSTAPTAKRPWIKDDDTKKYIYQLSDYSFAGERIMEYFGGNVKMYHRTFEEIFNTLINNNLKIDKISEPFPTKEELKLFPDREKILHKPSFLIIKATKI